MPPGAESPSQHGQQQTYNSYGSGDNLHSSGGTQTLNRSEGNALHINGASFNGPVTIGELLAPSLPPCDQIPAPMLTAKS